jgi:hypothetical protein
MTWWIIIYLGVVVVISGAGIWDDIRDGRPAWFLACAVVSNLVLIGLFVAFWLPWLRAPLGLVAPVAYIASMLWELFQAVEDLRGLRASRQLAEAHKQVIGVIVTLLLLMFILPVYIVAGISAFRG